MINPWQEPRVMNFVILTLYSVNVVWWAVHKYWWDALYWFAALLITTVVTFGYNC